MSETRTIDKLIWNQVHELLSFNYNVVGSNINLKLFYDYK